MVTPVKSRLTHYENLGLTPAATPDEIAEAFAIQIGITITSPEDAVEHADRVYVAYETLRDPIRRSAYDAAIGLWDREAAAEQEKEPFIGGKTRESPENEAHVDSAGGAPKSKIDQQGGPKANKAAIEWPVPQAKTLDEQAATHVDAEARGGKPRRAKNDRHRPGRAKKAQIDREARSGTSGSGKKGRRPPRRVSKGATDREALAGGTPAPAKRRRQVGRADKATPDRAAIHGVPDRRKSAAQRATGPMRGELRDEALERAGQVRSVAARDEAPTSRFAGAGAGVLIAAFGILTLVVGLVRGNYDQTPTAPSRTATDEQPLIPSTKKATAAGEEALAADEAQSEASSIGSVPRYGRQVSDAPHVAADTRALVDLLAGTPLGQADNQQATGGQFEQNAIGKAAVTPSRQSVTGQPAATPPRQLQVSNRQPARTPPQSAPYRQTLSAAQGKPKTQEDSREVSSSAIEEKTCMLLPLTGTRLPQQVCLTKKEWKQVEEEQGYARTFPRSAPYRQTLSAAQGKHSTQQDSREVSSSAIEGKICTHLPLTGTRLQQQVCLTSNEWKEVEEAQR